MNIIDEVSMNSGHLRKFGNKVINKAIAGLNIIIFIEMYWQTNTASIFLMVFLLNIKQN